MSGARRHVLRLRLPGHELHVGFLLRRVEPWAFRVDASGGHRGWRWKVARFLDEHSPVQQCWSDLAGWAMRTDVAEIPLRDLRPRDLLPRSDIRPQCLEDRERVGSCYCGKLRQPEATA